MGYIGKFNSASSFVDLESPVSVDGVPIIGSGGTISNATLDSTNSFNFVNDSISGDKIHGGTISNFASIGIDDNASSTALTIDASGNTTLGGNLVIPNSGTIGSVGDTDAITIDTNGNVGIGTNGSALTKFQVGQYGLGIDKLNDYAASLGHPLIWSSDGNAGGAFPAASGHLVIQARNTASRHIVFATGTPTSAERMRINSSGNVGIGTDNPNSGSDSSILLHCTKSILLGNSITDPNYSIISRNTGQGPVYYYPTATSGSSFWYRLAYLLQRMAYEVTLEWDGGYYTPGSKTFIIQRNWTNTLYVSSSTLVGDAGPNFTLARGGGSSAGGSWYLDVYASNATGPSGGYRNQFTHSIRPLGQGIVYVTYGGRGSTPSSAQNTVSDGVSAQTYSAQVSI